MEKYRVGPAHFVVDREFACLRATVKSRLRRDAGGLPFQCGLPGVVWGFRVASFCAFCPLAGVVDPSSSVEFRLSKKKKNQTSGLFG